MAFLVFVLPGISPEDPLELRIYRQIAIGCFCCLGNAPYPNVARENEEMLPYEKWTRNNFVFGIMKVQLSGHLLWGSQVTYDE